MSQLELLAVPADNERRADDAYYTPRPLAFAACRQLVALGINPPTIIEPNVGGGAFVDAALQSWPGANIHGCDIRAEAIEYLKPRATVAVRFEQRDWLDAEWDFVRADLILGNPPFHDAQQQIETSLRRLNPRGHLAYVLRVSMLGAKERVAMWSKPGLRWCSVIAPRPSFTKGGNDTADVALFVWEQGYTGAATLLQPLVWG